MFHSHHEYQASPFFSGTGGSEPFREPPRSGRSGAAGAVGPVWKGSSCRPAVMSWSSQKVLLGEGGAPLEAAAPVPLGAVSSQGRYEEPLSP